MLYSCLSIIGMTEYWSPLIGGGNVCISFSSCISPMHLHLARSLADLFLSYLIIQRTKPPKMSAAKNETGLIFLQNISDDC